MSAAGHEEPAADRVASRLRDADFVRLVATADGDALAATGLLARALRECDVPYQASLAAVPRTPSTEADCTVAIGHETGDVTLRSTPLSVRAVGIARELAAGSVDPELALAGIVSAGFEPSGSLLEAATLERRLGVAIPTDDRIDGLAGSTLFHAPFSGDETAVEAALEDFEGDDRELASLVALSAVQDAPPRAAEAVERALYPYECKRFSTLGGYADVLDAVARERPGTGIALALGNDIESAALESWRSHGQRAHEALRTATTGRYDGVFVARCDADEEGAVPLGTVARLLFAYRSPEPVALAVTDGEAAVVAETDTAAADALGAAAADLDGRSTARDGHGAATFDGTATDYVAAFREAL
ncbi:hypothetical protein [Natronomonas gomsonensis]|uniref:hypothetical protein n=1 Tax=Natronomonas gomsonensis TaxID=1046043 RepID=UPI0015BA7180|nr:hypothetical protein [Natronomonas gomsonensis]